MAAVEHELEIHAPERLTRRERARDTLVTALLWAFYCYLWAPLASLFAWLLGVQIAYDVMVRAGGVRGLEQEISGYLTVIVVIIVVVTAWSVSNRLRFRGRDRRRGLGVHIDDNEVRAYFGVSEDELAQLRSGRRLEIRLADDDSGAVAISVRRRD